MAENDDKFTIRLMQYGPDHLEELKDVPIADLASHLGKSSVLWIDCEGPIDAESLKNIGDIFNLHPLAQEDVLHSHQRAKVDLYEGHHFVVTRMVSFDNKRLASEQLSIFFGEGFVVTFQDLLGGDCLQHVRDRIRKKIGNIRKENSDHLAYELIDACVDGYFPVLDVLGERLNSLEDSIMLRYDPRFPSRIHSLKRDIWSLRRAIWPLRDMINTLIRDSRSALSTETLLYLRDCYDHAIRVIDLVETYHELCSDLMDLHLSRESGRMNEILKVLTIISTIFIPPTFIAGIYGMNFNPDASPLNMPELNWYYGYPFALALMIMLIVGLIVWLSWRGWLAPQPDLAQSIKKRRLKRSSHHTHPNPAPPV